jgi:RimJ/RimL family protein N-acetyltransferase
MNRIRLTPYNPSWFPVLESWIPDKEVLLQYSGTHFNYPLTETQMNAYLHDFPDRKLYMALIDSSTAFAFGEIIPQDKHSVRLARLIIGNPVMRGQGLGLAFVHALIAEAMKVPEITTIELFVISSNLPAIHCYRKAGFDFIPEGEHTIVTDGIAHSIQKMRLG